MKAVWISDNNHKKIKIESAKKGVEIQEVIEKAIDNYFENLPNETDLVDKSL